MKSNFRDFEILIRYLNNPGFFCSVAYMIFFGS